MLELAENSRERMWYQRQGHEEKLRAKTGANRVQKALHSALCYSYGPANATLEVPASSNG